MATGQTRTIGGIAPKKTTIPGKIPTGTILGEIFSNIPDRKLWGYNGSNVFEYGSYSYLGLTGGTITGNTTIIGNIDVTGIIVASEFSGTSISANTINSGSTNINNIFAQGSGTTNTIPVWSSIRGLTDSILSQSASGLTVNGSVMINGNVSVVGTATTFNTQTIQTADNNITMNMSGSHATAIGGGITVLSGQPNGGSSNWLIDSNGNWSANTGIYTSGITAGVFTSGSTDLYNIFALAGSDTNDITRVQNGINTYTGGTDNNPTVNVSALTIITLTVSGNTDLNAVTAVSVSAITLSAATSLLTPQIYGSSAANGDITIEGTSDATKTTSYINLQPTGGNVGIGITGSTYKLAVYGGDENTLKLDASSGEPAIFWSQAGSNKWEQRAGVDYGLYSYTTSSWPFYILGASGNVGIGTTTPLVALDIRSSSASTYMQIGLDDNNKTYFQNNNTSDYFKIQTVNSAINAGAITLQPDGGLVGIGTTAPLSKLGVAGNLSVGAIYGTIAAPTGGAIFQGNVGIGTTATTTPFEIAATQTVGAYGDGATAIKIKITNDASSIYGGIVWTDTNSGSGETFGIYPVRSGGVNSLYFTNNQVPVLVMNNDKIGIGTAAPAYIVDIKGVDPVLRLNADTGSSATYIRTALNGTGQLFTGVVGVNNWVGLPTGTLVNDAFTRFDGGKYYIVGGSSNAMTILSGGNVGVGTTTPSELLHVKTDQNADTVIVVENASTGSTAYSSFEARNGTSVNDAARLGVLGSSYTTSGGFITGSGFLSTEANISEGLSIITRHASAPIRFYTGGHTNQRMIITSGGSVGIGTTTPFGKFNIKTATDKHLVVDVNGGAGFTGTSVYAATDAGAYQFLQVDGSVLALNTRSGGNVGVGTATPLANLEVASLTGGTLRLTSSDLTITTAGESLGGIEFYSSDSSANAAKVYGSIETLSNGLFDGTGTRGGDMVFRTGTLTTPNTEKIRILADGNVGIGTAAPVVLLHLSSTTSLQQYVQTSFATGYAATQYINPNGAFYIGKERSSTGAIVTGDLANACILASSNTTPIQFGINDSVVMTIINGGNVGIGTAVPASKLGVVGNLAVGATYGASAATTSGAIIEGRVGIGTAAPLAMLEVVGASQIAYDRSTHFELSTGTGLLSDYKLIMGVYDANYAWIQSVKSGTGYYPILLNAYGGRVGIGSTTTPVSALGVTGNLAIGATYGVLAAPTSGAIIEGNSAFGTIDTTSWLHNTQGPYYSSLTVKNNVGTSSWNLALTSASGITPIMVFTPQNSNGRGVVTASISSKMTDGTLGNESGNLMFNTKPNIITGGQGYSNEKMRITGLGYVGIGTIAPASILAVSPRQYSIGTASQTLTTITGTGTTWTSAMVGSQFVYADGTDGGTIITFSSTTSLTVTTSQTVSGQTYIIGYTGLIVGNTGLVGIGNTSPECTLDLGEKNATYYTSNANAIFGMAAPTTDVAGTIRARLDFSARAAVAVQVGDAWKYSVGTIAATVGAGNYNSSLAFMRSTRNGVTDNPDMTINYQGYVGIGTTTPTSILDIVQNQNAGSRIILTNNSGGTSASSILQLQNHAGNAAQLLMLSSTFSDATLASGEGVLQINAAPLALRTIGANYMRFITNTSTEAMRITSAGRVGIGTNTPISSTVLDISGSNVSSLYLRHTNSSNNASANSQFRLENDLGNGSGIITYASTSIGTNYTTPNSVALFSVVGDTSIATLAAKPIRFFVNNTTEAMRILSGGSVGIGTTAATTTLEVNRTTANTGGYADGTVQISGNLNPLAFVGQSNLNPSLNRWGFVLREISDGDFSIRDFRSGGATRILINSSGYVGIGTTTPSSNFQVSAATNSGWATQISNEGTTSANGLYVNIGASSTGVPFRVDKGGTALVNVTNSGHLYLGTTTQVDMAWTGTDPKVQIFNTTTVPVYLKSYTSTAWSAPVLAFGHSAGAAIGTETALADGGTFGSITFEGVNSSLAKTIGAYIHSTQDGAAGATYVGGKLSFFTGTNSTPLAESMTILGNGNIGLGVIIPSAKLHLTATTEQLRLGYNSSNYFSTTIGSTGGVTFDAVGTGAGFTFNDPVNAGSLSASSLSLSGAGITVLNIIGSGTTQPIFRVQGSQGELFSITDSLSGSLFSVNDISGLPILEVFSDDTILMGNYNSPSLNTTKKVTANIGNTEVYSIPVSAYTAGFFDYTVSNGSSARAGSIMAIWSGAGSSIAYTETTTTDLGITTPLTFNISISGTSAVLYASATTNSWTVKTIIRSI